jgi:hypothetical protein
MRLQTNKWPKFDLPLIALSILTMAKKKSIVEITSQKTNLPQNSSVNFEINNSEELSSSYSSVLSSKNPQFSIERRQNSPNSNIEDKEDKQNNSVQNGSPQ